MRTIIIDDETESRAALGDALSLYCPKVDVVGQGTNGEHGLRLIRELQPELVFLDVEMPDLSGFEVLRSLGEVDFALIFVTAFNQYAVQAFDCSAVDYLLKPVDPARLVRAVEKVHERNHLQQLKAQYEVLWETIQSKNTLSLNNRITFSTQEEIIFVALKDLIRIEADQNCCSVYVEGYPRRIFIARHLKFYERLFEDVFFLFRVHRSHIINLHYVQKFLREDGGYVLVPNPDSPDGLIRIPVANRLRDTVIDRLQSL